MPSHLLAGIFLIIRHVGRLKQFRVATQYGGHRRVTRITVIRVRSPRDAFNKPKEADYFSKLRCFQLSSSLPPGRTQGKTSVKQDHGGGKDIYPTHPVIANFSVKYICNAAAQKKPP